MIRCILCPVTRLPSLSNFLIHQSSSILQPTRRCLLLSIPNRPCDSAPQGTRLLSFARYMSTSSAHANKDDADSGENFNHENPAGSETNSQTDKFIEVRKEVANLLAIGWQAPETISDFDAEHYLTLTTKKGRKKFLRFLLRKEMIKKRESMKKEERRKQRAEMKENEDQEEDAFPNRLFLRLQSNTIQQFDQWRLAAGMKFGSKIVFDFSYEELMRRQEVISLIQQLMHVVNANKYAREPFDVHWVGLTEQTQSMKLMKHMKSDSLERTLVNITDKDLLDVFPKEKLIYLSADSPNVLKSFDSDKVHVIGALVDRSAIITGQSMARAKRHGIDHARLPLDRYLQWSTGAKELTLDQVIRILIELNTSGDWVTALQHVPIRKHAGLRSGPHFDQDAQKAGLGRRKQDSILRNRSHFVASRARQSTHLKQEQRGSNSQLSASRPSKSEEQDETDGTIFSSRTKSDGWFESDR